MSRLRALVIPSPTCRAYVRWRRGRGAAPRSRAPAACPRRRRRAPRAFPDAGRPDTCLPATAQAARQAPNTIGVSCPGMSAGPDKIEQKIKKDHLAEREVVHGRGKAASPQWHQDRPLTLAPYPAAGPPSAIPIAALPARQHDPSRASTQLQQRPRYPGPPSPPRPSGHQPRSPGPQARPDPPDTSPRPPAPHPGRR
jgi:hypothetical protein